ncbi:MAG: hypothetical protein IPG50_35080 [Myxococcales bacterium]|nr:hypothetical protein [Myxococcales bacterium]
MHTPSLRILSALTLAGAFIACSDVPNPTTCRDDPNMARCKKATPSMAEPSSGASTMAAQPPPQLPAVPDAGPRPRKPDAGPPALPPSTMACSDLLRCCMRVSDIIERAACLAIGYAKSVDQCANAVIAYQVFGGCNHDPFSLPDIFNSDGSRNEARDCAYLQDMCDRYGQCDAYNQCIGIQSPSGGFGGWGSESGGDPYGPPSPCDGYPRGSQDRECCVDPYSYACMGPT